MKRVKSPSFLSQPDHQKRLKSGDRIIFLMGEFALIRMGFDPAALVWFRASFGDARVFSGWGALRWNSTHLYKVFNMTTAMVWRHKIIYGKYPDAIVWL